MAYQIRRLPDAPWPGRDGHAMLAAKLGAGSQRLVVMGGWNPGDTAAEQDYFPDTRTSDVWICESLADLEKGVWTRHRRASAWSARHNFGCVETTGFDDKVHVFNADVQDGFYRMDHWVGSSPGVFLRNRPTNAGHTMPMDERVLAIQGYDRPYADVLCFGGEKIPGVVGPPGESAVRHTDLWGFRATDGNWRQIIANCPALPRSAVNKAVEHVIGATRYIYLYTGGDYAQSDMDSEVWRCPSGLLHDSGSWELVATAPWQGRIYSCIESWNGSLWMIGGNRTGGTGASANGNLGDIWYSADNGVTWTEAAFTIPNRHAAATAVWNNKIIITGGSADSARLNDVWVIEDV